jgi:D-arabinitol dehydrogenase (NADP+)
MRALTIRNPDEVSVREVPVPDPGPNEVQVRVAACGICGTDVHILRGEYMGEYPIVPGHEFAGEVTAVGAGVTRFHVGDRVAVEPNIACDNCRNCLNNRQNFCLNWQAIGVTRQGGMAEYLVAPEKAIFPTGELAHEVAAFMEPLSCVVHGIESVGIKLGDRVAILGAGPIGLLLLQVVRFCGAVDTTVLERQDARGALAEAYGANRWVRDLHALSAGTYDVVIDATGVPALMAQTVALARQGGNVLLFGVPPRGAEISLDAFAVFEKGLTLRSSFTSRRNSYQALALLQSGEVRVDQLISHRLPLEAFEEGVAMIEAGRDGVTKVLMVPDMAA